MPIYLGDWEDEEGVPFDPRWYQFGSTDAGGSCRRMNPRKWIKSAPRQSVARNAMTIVARTWSEVMSPVDQASWLENDLPFNNRCGDPVVEKAYQRFYNVNFPLAYSNKPMIYERQIVRYYGFDTFILSDIHTPNQQLELQFTFQRYTPGLHYAIVHVFQVDPRFVDTYMACRYTHWLHSWEVYTNVTDPDWETESRWYDAAYGFDDGDKVQLFVRVTINDDRADPLFGWGPVTFNTPAGPLIGTAP